MEYRELGRTGARISSVSLGTGSIGGFYGALQHSDALRLLDAAVDAGINFLDTSAYYGSAEERIGAWMTPANRERVLIGTKAGRYGAEDFDFSPARLRESLEDSLRLMRTDHVDVFHLHDIEFVPLGPVFEDSYAELVALKNEGKCRFIGMTGYPVRTFQRAMRETDLDVVLTYAKATLLDDSLTTELLPVAEERGVGLMNAAAVALGLLTPRGVPADAPHQAPAAVRAAADRMRALAEQEGVDLAFLANQYSIQHSGAATTVVGVGKTANLRSALEAAETPIDEGLLARFLALRPELPERQWLIGLEENN